jgi:hypothetical protein
MKNIIVVAYQGGDGGNFLINCLTMSNKVTCPRLSKNDKIQYFFDNLTEIGNKWVDVNMFSYSLMADEIDAHQMFLSKESENIIMKIHYPLFTINENINNEIKIKNLNTIKKVLEKRKLLIVFENPMVFSRLRHFSDSDSKCPMSESFVPLETETYPKDELLNVTTISEYKSFPKEKKQEIENKYNMSISKLIEIVPPYKPEYDLFFMGDVIPEQKSSIYIWNVNWYLDEEMTLYNIKKLYETLEFDDYDEKLIRDMYRSWIKKLDEIKKYHVEIYK